MDLVRVSEEFELSEFELAGDYCIRALLDEFVLKSVVIISLVFTSDISIRKITKESYPLEVYEDKQKEFSFEFAFVLMELISN